MWPHIVFIIAVIVGVTVGVLREGWSASLISNLAWAGLYIAIFSPFIQAAFEKQKVVPVEKTVSAKQEASVS